MRLPSIVVALAALILTACAGGAPPTPSPIVTPAPTPQPSPSPAGAFYLRAWYSQALPPRETFGWGPVITIAEGLLIDGNVAVPAIFPGPLLVAPMARTISNEGIAAVVGEADRLGLLSGQSDFTGDAAMPGSRLGQIEIIIDGARYSLTGNPDAVVRCDGARCDAAPGTPAAFAAFWQQLTMLQASLESELGPVAAYQPDRLALLLSTRLPNDPNFALQPIEWPLDVPLAAAGVEFPGEEGARCLTMNGDDLAVVLPLLLAGTQLSVLVDEAGDLRAPVVRVLVPGEDSPCPDAG